MGTYILQRDLKELEELAATFMDLVCPMVTGREKTTSFLGISRQFQSHLIAEDFRVARVHAMSITTNQHVISNRAH